MNSTANIERHIVEILTHDHTRYTLAFIAQRVGEAQATTRTALRHLVRAGKVVATEENGKVVYTIP